MLKVLADKYLYNIARYFSDEIDLQLYDPNKSDLYIPDGTQALLIRTVTKINPQTFSSFPDSLKFIATGSAGTNHIDLSHLASHDIAFAHAGGCNARSVAEYVAVSLLIWADQKDGNLKDYSVGIVGVGHTGGEVQKILRALGMTIVTYDPPREDRDSSFHSATLNEVLQSDILTFHTPLTEESSYPTWHWFNEEKIKGNQFKLIINAARGSVVDEQALFKGYKENKIGDYIFDVWENEPQFDDDIARHACIKTPHIAGYSIEAKNNASRMITESLAKHFSVEDAILPVQINNSKEQPLPRFWSLIDLLTYYHPIQNYETRFKMLMGRACNEKATGFNRIRTNHPLRHELKSITIPSDIAASFPIAKPLFK